MTNMTLPVPYKSAFHDEHVTATRACECGQLTAREVKRWRYWPYTMPLMASPVSGLAQCFCQNTWYTPWVPS